MILTGKQKNPKPVTADSESNEKTAHPDSTLEKGIKQDQDDAIHESSNNIPEEESASPLHVWAGKYIKKDLAIIPVPHKSKNPNMKDWQNKKISADQVQKEFSPNSNIGLLNGEPSGGACDVDIDSKEFKAFSSFLPKTGMRGGHPSNPNSHFFYKVTGTLPKSVKYTDEDNSVLGEIRSTGTQTLVHPSIHPNGDQYAWEEFGKPAELTCEELLEAVGGVASLAILLRLYPCVGSRQEFALALSGTLLRFGMSPSDVEIFIERLAKESVDEEWKKRIKIISYTQKRLENNEPVYGCKRLSSLIGKKVVNKILEWLNLTNTSKNNDFEDNIDTVILNLNKKHAVVTVAGKTLILNEDYDPSMKRDDISFSSASDFKLRYQNESILIGEKNGEGVSKKISIIWLNHKHRRGYSRIVFAPGGAKEEYFNLFKGFPVNPVQGSCYLYWQHIYMVICDGNEVVYKYLRKWMAHAIQHPDELPGVAIVLRGRQGVGKGVFVENFGMLFGSHYLSVHNMSQVAGRFNGHSKDLLLLHANEAIWGGNKSSEGVLKGLITDPFTPIEFKGKDIISVRNYKRLIVASNERWAVPIGADDRRFLVLDVSDKYKEDEKWFAPIFKQMENGGVEALMFDLQNEDLSGFNIRKMPPSMMGFDMKLQSLEAHFAWIYECLLRGYTVPDDQEKSIPSFGSDTHSMDEIFEWNYSPSKKALHRNYVEFCKNQNIQHTIAPSIFSKELKKVFPSIKDTKITINGSRVSVYRIPILEICRHQFENFTKSDPSIWSIMPEYKPKMVITKIISEKMMNKENKS